MILARAVSPPLGGRRKKRSKEIPPVWSAGWPYRNSESSTSCRSRERCVPDWPNSAAMNSGWSTNSKSYRGSETCDALPGGPRALGSVRSWPSQRPQWKHRDTALSRMAWIPPILAGGAGKSGVRLDWPAAAGDGKGHADQANCRLRAQRHHRRMLGHDRNQTTKGADQSAPHGRRKHQPLQDRRCIRRHRTAFDRHRLPGRPVGQLLGIRQRHAAQHGSTADSRHGGLLNQALQAYSTGVANKHPIKGSVPFAR